MPSARPVNSVPDTWECSRLACVISLICFAVFTTAADMSRMAALVLQRLRRLIGLLTHARARAGDLFGCGRLLGDASVDRRDRADHRVGGFHDLLGGGGLFREGTGRGDGPSAHRLRRLRNFRRTSTLLGRRLPDLRGELGRGLRGLEDVPRGAALFQDRFRHFLRNLPHLAGRLHDAGRGARLLAGGRRNLAGLIGCRRDSRHDRLPGHALLVSGLRNLRYQRPVSDTPPRIFLRATAVFRRLVTLVGDARTVVRGRDRLLRNLLQGPDDRGDVRGRPRRSIRQVADFFGDHRKPRPASPPAPPRWRH